MGRQLLLRVRTGGYGNRFVPAGPGGGSVLSSPLNQPSVGASLPVQSTVGTIRASSSTTC